MISSVEVVAVEQHQILRQRVFNVTGHDISDDVISAILRMVRSERATGQIIIDISQGTPGRIHFEERAKLS